MTGVSKRDAAYTCIALLILGGAMTALVLLTSTGPAHAPDRVPKWNEIPVHMPGEVSMPV